MAQRDEELWMAQQEARFWREEARRIFKQKQLLADYLDTADELPQPVIDAMNFDGIPPGDDTSHHCFRETVRVRVLTVLREMGVEV